MFQLQKFPPFPRPRVAETKRVQDLKFFFKKRHLVRGWGGEGPPRLNGTRASKIGGGCSSNKAAFIIVLKGEVPFSLTFDDSVVNQSTWPWCLRTTGTPELGSPASFIAVFFHLVIVVTPTVPSTATIRRAVARSKLRAEPISTQRRPREQERQ